MRILLAEDDALLGEGLYSALKRQGHAIDWLRDGEAARQALALEPYELLLLDLGLPRRSGMQLLQALRAGGKTTAVIILTARDQLDDRIAGLDAGADDYLVKPFNLSELEARIRALQRRLQGRVANRICHGAIELDSQLHQAWYRGEEVNLSRREFALLEELLNHPGQLLSKEFLTQRLYAWQEDVESNALEVHIHHLRKKLYPGLIRTQRGLGYQVEAKP